MKHFFQQLIDAHKDFEKIVELGIIEVKDGRLIVTDPCYEVGTWCQGEVSVKNGFYAAYAVITNEGFWGKRVAELVIVKDGVDDFDLFSPLDLDFEVGVDSGQAGFFNTDYFAEHQPDDDWDNEKSWYRRVCDITCNTEYSCGTIDGEGVVSESGYGDGGYCCYPAYDKDEEIVGLRIVFIEDDSLLRTIMTRLTRMTTTRMSMARTSNP